MSKNTTMVHLKAISYENKQTICVSYQYLNTSSSAPKASNFAQPRYCCYGGGDDGNREHSISGGGHP